MFDNIVTFQNISNKHCTQYNTNEDAKENELLMNKQCLLLFKFLEVAEILRNHEFIVKVRKPRVSEEMKRILQLSEQCELGDWYLYERHTKLRIFDTC